MSYTIDKTKFITYPPSALRDFQVYGFEWIDNLHFVRPVSEFLANPDEYVEIARARFLEAEWDGDGWIGLLWIPPFVFPLACNVSPEGVVVWHVKQEEDGVSFLLSPVELAFEEFKDRPKSHDVNQKLLPGT